MANVDKNCLIITDLSNSGFEIVTVGSNRAIAPRVSTASGNRLRLTEQGLEVTDPPMRHFLLNPSTNVRMTDNQDFRRILYLTGNLGVLHLDFTLTRGSGNTLIFTVPDNCPLPRHIIEMNANGGYPIWWVPGERSIYADGRVSKNQRIIFHTSGIFA